MSPSPVALTGTILLAVPCSLLLAGCGGGTVSTTQVPATSTPAGTTAAPDPDTVMTTPTPDPRPQSKCCWSNWGNHYDCGNYPQDRNTGLCNNDITKECFHIEDCADLAPHSTTAAPTTTTTPKPTTTTTTLPEGACVKTSRSGCLNGQSFAFDEQFVCGTGSSTGLYRWGHSACCAHGLNYDVQNDFCCNNVLNVLTDGQCHTYDPNDDPEGCRCPSHTEATEVAEVAAGADDTVVIDTNDWRNPPETPCFMADGAMSCLNGFLFDMSTDLVCGQYIVKGDGHGCCTTHDGVQTYNLQTESCCQFGPNGAVIPGAHACQCREWPNPNCAGSLFSTVV